MENMDERQLFFFFFSFLFLFVFARCWTLRERDYPFAVGYMEKGELGDPPLFFSFFLFSFFLLKFDGDVMKELSKAFFPPMGEIWRRRAGFSSPPSFWVVCEH